MPLPANTTTVVVLGTFNTPEGNPSTGTITFTPSAWLLNSGANIAIPNSAVSKTLGTAGNFSVTLPITDDADLSPSPFIYTVSEVIDGVSQSYNISIPGTVASGGTVYLADLAPVAAAGPEYYSLASSLAIGTVTTLAAGSAATATITGLAPSQTLNLGLPTASLGALTPQALGVAAAGSSGTASREDHVHSSTVANPTFTGQVIVPAGSAGTPAISPTGDTNTGIFSSGADTVNIATGGTERLRVDSSGNVGVAMTPTSSGTGGTPLLQASGGDVLGGWRGGADANPPNIVLHKTRNATATSHTAVTLDDQLGQVNFYGSDGSGWIRGVAIRALCDGTVATGDVPGRLAIYTKPASASFAERLRIDSNGLITGTGTSLGAWTSYTPTLGGTSWAIGNGSFSAVYCQIGKMVFFKAQFTAGSTTTFGSDSPTITLPVTSSGSARAASMVTAHALDVSTGNVYQMAPLMNSTTTVSLRTLGTSGLHTATTSTVPFTWDGATADTFRVGGVYEAA